MLGTRVKQVAAGRTISHRGPPSAVAPGLADSVAYADRSAAPLIFRKRLIVRAREEKPGWRAF